MPVEPASCVAPTAPEALDEALSEDLPSAQNSLAAEAASDYYELDRPPRQRKVPDATPVMAMNAARNSPARRTKTKTL